MSGTFLQILTPSYVIYDGKKLPQEQATEQFQEQPITSVVYNGKTLPTDKGASSMPIKDLSNDPSTITLTNLTNFTVLGTNGFDPFSGGVTLPKDVKIRLNGRKILAMAPLLDDPVNTIQKIQRKPYCLDFDFTALQTGANGNYVFPQDLIYDLFTKVWSPDTVVMIRHTLLNKLGIQELVFDEIDIDTIRGNVKVPIRLRAYENIPGQSLNV